MDNREVILDIQDLHARFHTQDGVVHAVNGITYQVHAGETLGIVGESGCGKSVSMLSVMDLLAKPPAEVQAEAILFKGEDLQHFSQAEMRKVRGSNMTMIFQDPMTSLNPVLTVGFQIKEPLKLHLGMSDEEATKRAAELLELVNIPEAENRLSDFPHQFSGGMRQRAMVAIALACNPTLLIADEPTTALDVTIQAQLVELVKGIQAKLGMALIWITHDLGVVAGLAERVIVMYAGFVVEDAQIDELYGNPLHPYTLALLKSLPRLDQRKEEALATIEGLPPSLLERPQSCPFEPRCEFAKPKCKESNPLLEAVGPDHKIACWVDIKTGELR
ncbi:MAG TPA: ABC transporter ATP-binding protein [Chloroflexi bacterium]|nr:MAG: peptide ABC transporter ATP-binding protein [Chloroflexota bacterium]HDD54783.1 ABC transporter ATP-binding protein [Chloroflexota bacterium]